MNFIVVPSFSEAVNRKRAAKLLRHGRKLGKERLSGTLFGTGSNQLSPARGRVLQRKRMKRASELAHRSGAKKKWRPVSHGKGSRYR